MKKNTSLSKWWSGERLKPSLYNLKKMFKKCIKLDPYNDMKVISEVMIELYEKHEKDQQGKVLFKMVESEYHYYIEKYEKKSDLWKAL